MSAVVSTEGATVDGIDGVRLVFPPGAVASDVTIVVTPAPTRRPPEGLASVATPLSLSPRDLRFSAPVEVTTALPALPRGRAPSEVVVIIGDADSGTFAPLPTRVTSATEVVATTDRFGDLFTVVRDPGVPDPFAGCGDATCRGAADGGTETCETCPADCGLCLVTGMADGGVPDGSSGMDAGTGGPVTCPTAGAIAGRVVVDCGTYTMGLVGSGADEVPTHSVSLSTFYVDATEVTASAYASCVAASNCSLPGTSFGCNWTGAAPTSGRESHPINCVTWDQATAYCAWAGGRLPTEAEWEHAARGADGRPFPWGTQTPDDTLVYWSGTTSRTGTTTVGALAAGASATAAFDMAGNVSEWVSDYYGAYDAAAVTNPGGPASGTDRVRRGGGYTAVIQSDVRATVRAHNPATFSAAYVGFRCAYAAP